MCFIICMCTYMCVYIYIYISATVPLCTKLACGVLSQGRPTGTSHQNTFLEKWQSHCSEKVNEIDFSKGAPKSRIWKFAPLCSEIATFAENVRFFLPGEPGRRLSHAPPRGTLKSPKFRLIFESVSNGLWGGTGTSKWPHWCLKAPQRGPKSSLWVPSGITFELKIAILAPC